MSIASHSRLRTRAAAAVLALTFGAAVFLTYLSYTDAFTSKDLVVVTAPRAGLVLDVDAKVKFRGLQIGRVESIKYSPNEAIIDLAVKRSALRYLPANSIVRIASTTIFGGKSVEFTQPPDPVDRPLQPGARIAASSVQLEVNTLFQTLSDLLSKIDPVKLNSTITALADGLRGNGDDLGQTIQSLNQLLSTVNPYLPTLGRDLRQTATVANIYAAAAPDLVTITKAAPTIATTIAEQKDDLTATLLSVTGLANEALATVAPAKDDIIATLQRFRAPLKVLSDYSPEFGCLFEASAYTIDSFGPVIGGRGAGVYASASFIPGVPAYTYPESLPTVNASGGPNCRGLPNLPGKQRNGSFYRAPFLVTDNAYVPFQPNTELQFDPPSTLQFLFNGAYAERDDF